MSLTPALLRPVSKRATRADLVAASLSIAAVALFLAALAIFCALRLRAKSLALARRHEERIPIGTISRPSVAHGPRPSIESENDLSAALGRLDVQIQKHVKDNYLRDEQEVDRNKLAEAVAGLPVLKHDVEFLTRLCSAPDTRRAALRHVIAANIISAIDFTTLSEHVLLPQPLITFWETLPVPFEANMNFKNLHLWQTLSIRLLQQENFVDGQVLEPPESIQPQVSKLAGLLDLVLSNFAPADPEERQRQNQELHDLIWASARLGYRILSHARRWSFSWKGDRSELVLLPRLSQLSDPSGRMLAEPRLVGPVVIATILGESPESLQRQQSVSKLSYSLPADSSVPEQGHAMKAPHLLSSLASASAFTASAENDEAAGKAALSASAAAGAAEHPRGKNHHKRKEGGGGCTFLPGLICAKVTVVASTW
ncbi:hypothetical protein VTK26DRAFT_9251 [Humicola hyalothermophila]